MRCTHEDIVYLAERNRHYCNQCNKYVDIKLNNKFNMKNKNAVAKFGKSLW